MKKNFGLLILLCLLTAVAFAQPGESAGVKKAFETYKTAILNDQGAAAYEAVDSRTRNYYEKLIGIVRNADSNGVAGLSLVDRVTVLAVRHRGNREEIRKMDGKALFIWAIDNGMVGKNGVAQNEVGEVTVSGSFAKGQLINNGKATPLYFHFYREGSTWKMDLTALFPMSNMAMSNLVKQSGVSETEFLFTILENLTGRKPGPEIWKKLD